MSKLIIYSKGNTLLKRGKLVRIRTSWTPVLGLDPDGYLFHTTLHGNALGIIVETIIPNFLLELNRHMFDTDMQQEYGRVYGDRKDNVFVYVFKHKRQYLINIRHLEIF
jgi:hypothetical protein